MKVAYKEIDFRPETLGIIEQANRILEEYAGQGYSLTLRQLYYQFVARDLIPNSQRSYKRMGSIINDGRLAGMIDWSQIEDRTRNVRSVPHWRKPADIIRGAADQFRIDKWEGQDNRVEVWIEKDALVGVIEDTCRSLDVAWFSCRGYASQSELWRAAERMREYEERWYCQTAILHLADHDPSGIDMTRDIQDRLALFGVDTRVYRIALTREQVAEYGPPPNPAKVTDSRARDYIRRFGPNSWELDALEPQVLNELVDFSVGTLRDDDMFDEAIGLEADYRSTLKEASRRWSEVEALIGGDA